MSTWSYCTLHRATLLLFTFDIYDTDHNGSLTMDEMNAMLKDLFGSDYRSKRAAVIAALEADSLGAKDGDFNIDDFRVFARVHGSMLSPAFKVQNDLRERIAGQAFWARLANSRIFLQNKKQGKGMGKSRQDKGKEKEEEVYVSAWELLDLHTHSEYQLMPREKHNARRRTAKHGRRRSRTGKDVSAAQLQEVLGETGARGYRHNADATTSHHTNATSRGDYTGDKLYAGLVDDKYTEEAGDKFVASKVFGNHGAVLYEQDTNVNHEKNSGARADRFKGEADDQTWMHARKQDLNALDRNVKGGTSLALRENVQRKKVNPKGHGKT